MTQIWDDENRVVPVTVIEAGPCRVVQLKTPERDGYSAIQLAFGDVKPRRINKPETGHFKKADQAPATGTWPRCGWTTARRSPHRPGHPGRRLRQR